MFKKIARQSQFTNAFKVSMWMTCLSGERESQAVVGCVLIYNLMANLRQSSHARNTVCHKAVFVSS